MQEANVTEARLRAAEEASLRAAGKVLLCNGAVLRREAYMPDEVRALRMLDAGTITRDEYAAQHGQPTTAIRRR